MVNQTTFFLKKSTEQLDKLRFASSTRTRNYQHLSYLVQKSVYYISDCLPDFIVRFEIVQGIEMQAKASISFAANTPEICLDACKKNHVSVEGTHFFNAIYRSQCLSNYDDS